MKKNKKRIYNIGHRTPNVFEACSGGAMEISRGQAPSAAPGLKFQNTFAPEGQWNHSHYRARQKTIPPETPGIRQRSSPAHPAGL